jgi:hypothetical protein
MPRHRRVSANAKDTYIYAVSVAVSVIVMTSGARRNSSMPLVPANSSAHGVKEGHRRGGCAIGGTSACGIAVQGPRLPTGHDEDDPERRLPAQPALKGLPDNAGGTADGRRSSRGCKNVIAAYRVGGNMKNQQPRSRVDCEWSDGIDYGEGQYRLTCG